MAQLLCKSLLVWLLMELATVSVSRCGSYCDMYGQLVPAQQCGPHQTCCGDLRMRTCCYTSDVERSDNLVKGLWKDASCDGISNVIADHHDNDDDDSDDDDPTSKVSSTTTQALTIMDIPTMQWWWLAVPLVTMTCLMITLAVCYCIRYQEMCRQSRSAYGGRNRALTTSSSNSQTPCRTDFDQSDSFAFAPPPYDSLPKDPPTYAEICANTNDSFWIGENGGESQLPPAYRGTSGTSQDNRQQQQPNVAMTSEPPYVEVIY